MGLLLPKTKPISVGIVYKPPNFFTIDFSHLLYLSDEESFQMQYTGMVSAREDGFKTDVSLHIQPFFKQNHLDYYL